MRIKTTTQVASVQDGRKLEQFERGAASIFVELENGAISVWHGTDHALLFESKVKPGTWDAMWSAIRGGVK